MQYQVARLAEAMQQQPEEPRSRHEQLRDLQMAWYRAGPVPLDAQASLEARFERAVSAVAAATQEPD
jgi:hypothetical protein